MKIVLIVGFSFVLIICCGYFLLQSYLHSDKFRVLMGQVVGGVIGADVEFKPLEWQGMNVRTEGLRGEGTAGVKSLHAMDLAAEIRLYEVLLGNWLIQDLRLANLQVGINLGDQQSAIITGLPSGPDSSLGSGGNQDEGFLDRMLPSRVKLQALEVSSLGLKVYADSGVLELADGSLRATRRPGKKHNYDYTVSGGLISTPWLEFPVKLDSANGRYADKSLYLQHSSSQVYGDGRLLLSGELAGNRWQWFGTLEKIDVGKIVHEDWKKRLSGVLHTEFKVMSNEDGFTTQGEMVLNKGLLTALPVLDRMAAYTNTNRFRQLRLTECRFKYSSEHREGSSGKDVRIVLRDVVLVSEGLVRVTGDLVIDDGNLDGDFRVGIVPGLLAHIPGAESKVFERGEKGLRWAPLRITGTIDKPKEDLSERIIAAAGERIIELLPETGDKALKFAHDKAAELPKAAVDLGSDIIDQGDKVIEQGVDILREGVDGALDLIPGFDSSPTR